MAFGTRRSEWDTVPVVDWATAGEFDVSVVVRRFGAGRARVVRGPEAVRVPEGEPADRVYAPCAFFAPAPIRRASVAAARRLYEDGAAQRPLCCVDDAEDVAGGMAGERRYRVRDGRGEPIGMIRRIPPAQRPFQHTWRIDQPGRPEIVGRNQWATADPRRLLGPGGRKAVTGVLGVVGIGAEDADVGAGAARTLEWWAGDELVMTSQRAHVKITAEWLDRRLAFAFAILGDL